MGFFDSETEAMPKESSEETLYHRFISMHWKEIPGTATTPIPTFGYMQYNWKVTYVDVYQAT